MKIPSSQPVIESTTHVLTQVEQLMLKWLLERIVDFGSGHRGAISK